MMTLQEYISSLESEDDSIDKSWLKHWQEQLPKMLEETELIHEGDCTSLPFTCRLCWLEVMLSEYRELTFKEKGE